MTIRSKQYKPKLLILLITLTCFSQYCVAWQQPHGSASYKDHFACQASLQQSRRILFQSAAACTAGLLQFQTTAAVATNNEVKDDTALTTSSQQQQRRRPFAPMQALVPAMQQKLLLEKVEQLTQQLAIKSRADSDLTEIMGQLKELVEAPSSSSSSTAKFAIGATKRYAVESQQSITPSDSAIITKLSGAKTRAAMNTYTANLRFSDSYLLTASPSEKSRMLRDKGAFPNVKQVVTADLDLRDLYRNLAQTTLDDVAAELYATETDVSELSKLTKEAVAAFDQWLSFIDEQDVRAARSAASMP
ncbi:hypothetical protein MPSEU_001005900 [Mayamaea pseudoterrestris]|nr:hypothetical protein MPSEU_001005900 [Mayamaea pseudoterrestris]